MEIPNPPDRRGCTSCMSRLRWVWSPVVKDWLALTTAEADTWRVHDDQKCKERHRRPGPETVRRGVALARQAINQASTGGTTQ